MNVFQQLPFTATFFFLQIMMEVHEYRWRIYGIELQYSLGDLALSTVLMPICWREWMWSCQVDSVSRASGVTVNSDWKHVSTFFQNVLGEEYFIRPIFLPLVQMITIMSNWHAQLIEKIIGIIVTSKKIGTSLNFTHALLH